MWHDFVCCVCHVVLQAPYNLTELQVGVSYLAMGIAGVFCYHTNGCRLAVSLRCHLQFRGFCRRVRVNIILRAATGWSTQKRRCSAVFADCVACV